MSEEELRTYTVTISRSAGKHSWTGEVFKKSKVKFTVEATSRYDAYMKSYYKVGLQFPGQKRRFIIDNEEWGS